MSRDLNIVATSELQAEYDAAIAKIRELNASLEPLIVELSKRSNARVFIYNTVLAGHGMALLANGVSKQAIDEAEQAVAAAKAHKQARRAAQEVSS